MAPPAPSWNEPAAASSWDVPKSEEPAAPAAPSWGAPSSSPEVSPAAAWAPPVAEEPAPHASATSKELAAGAVEGAVPAAAEPAAPAESHPPAPPPWQPPHVEPSIAATIPAGLGAGADAPHESTTLMPAWQPPPPTPPAIPDTAIMGGPTQPVLRATPGGGPQAELTIESGPDAGHTYRATESALRMGRSPDNDLLLRDPATSGHHARVERRGEQFWIVDLGSTNGTLVNGEPIQEKELKHDDRITIGQNAVHFALLGS